MLSNSAVAGGPFQIRSRKWDLGVLIGSVALLVIGFGGLFVLQGMNSAGNPTLLESHDRGATFLRRPTPVTSGLRWIVCAESQARTGMRGSRRFYTTSASNACVRPTGR